MATDDAWRTSDDWEDIATRFYSTSFECKLETLQFLVGKTFRVQELLDAIAGGAGECERASFGTHDGKVRWISCLMSHHGRVVYVAVVMDDYSDKTRCDRYTWGTLGLNNRTDDNPLNYAEFAVMVDEHECEEGQ